MSTEEYDESSPTAFEYLKNRTHNLKYDGSETETSVGPSYQKSTNRRIGRQNPRWKEQVKRGLDATTPFEGWEYSRSPRSAYFIQVYHGVHPPYTPLGSETEIQTAQGIRARGLPGSPSGLSEVKANNEALKQLVRKITSKQNTFQGSVFVGEMLQTIKLISNPAGTLRKSVDYYLRDTRNTVKRLKKSAKRLGKKRHRAAITNAIRDTWLEYQLGWAPLLSDIDSGAQALAESTTQYWDPTFESVRAVGVDESRLYQGKYSIPNAQIAYFEADMFSTSRVTVRYISCIGVGSYQLSNLKRVGFAPSDFLPTVWELIPYSFVIDYFTNIGDIIQAASLARSSVRWTVKTVRKENINSFENWQPRTAAPGSRNYYNILSSYSPSKVLSTAKHVQRYSYGGSFVPYYQFEIPTPKQLLNVGALVDAARQNKLESFYR